MFIFWLMVRVFRYYRMYDEYLNNSFARLNNELISIR